jgi:hypothetical protein
MAGNGPPPKHPSTRARRNAPTTSTTTLPAKGRGSRKAPAWPLPADVEAQVRLELAQMAAERVRSELNECEDRRSVVRLEGKLDKLLIEAAVLEAQVKQRDKLERAMWSRMWKMPQATRWDNCVHRVATYVRLQVRADLGDDDALKLLLPLDDRLGVSPKAMAALRWEVERAEDAEQRGARRRSGAAPAKPQSGGDAQPDPRRHLSSVS